MVKTKTLVVRLTDDQEIELRLKARSAGFSKKSDYVRCALFKPALLGIKKDA